MASSNSRASAYARAILETALEAWASDLASLQAKLQVDPATAAALEDFGRSEEEREALALSLLSDDASPDLRAFVHTLVARGHISLAGEVVTELRRLVAGGRSALLAQVRTAVELPEDQREALRETLRQRFGPDTEFEWAVDPSLIGGVVVRVGDELVDGSVTARVEALRQRLRSSA